MSDYGKFWNGGTGAASKMRRRDFVAGSVLAGTGD